MVSIHQSLITIHTPLLAKRFLNLPQGQTIHHVRFRQPAFARHADAEPEVLQALDAMCVRIDDAFDSFLLSQRPPPPVQIEPFRRGVDLDPGAGLGRGVYQESTVQLL